MKKESKILVDEKIQIENDTFVGDVSAIIAMLERHQSQGWNNISMEEYGYDGVVEFYLHKMRDETDEEYETRIKKEKEEEKRKLKDKEKRKKQYEILKKEFENG